MNTGFWLAVLSSIVASALFSGFAAFFGARILLNRYYREKWWDRKADAYLSLTKHFRRFNELLPIIEKNLFNKNFSEAKHIAAQLEEASKEFLLDFFANDILLSQEAITVATRIYGSTSDVAHSVMSMKENPKRIPTVC